MAEKICFGHPKESIRGFIRRIFPDKCGVRLIEAVESSEVIECLNNPEVVAVIVDDSILTDAHVDVLRKVEKPVVVITDNPTRWNGIRTVPKDFTIESLLEKVKATVVEKPVEKVKQEEKVKEVAEPVKEVVVEEAPVLPEEKKVEVPKASPEVSPEISPEEVKSIVREEIRHVIREILWEILPLQAEKILREEIRNILKERLAK